MSISIVSDQQKSTSSTTKDKILDGAKHPQSLNSSSVENVRVVNLLISSIQLQLLHAAVILFLLKPVTDKHFI